MKKLMCVFLALGLLLSLAACGEKAAPPKTLEGTPEEIIAKIYDNHKELKLKVMSSEIDLSDGDGVSYYTGLQNGDKLSAAWVSEPMMSSQAYSLVVARVKNAADAPQVAKEMYDKVDTGKWICVNADTKTAAYYGDVVLLFMADSQFAESATTDTILEAFKTVCGDNVTVVG